MTIGMPKQNPPSHGFLSRKSRNSSPRHSLPMAPARLGPPVERLEYGYPFFSVVYFREPSNSLAEWMAKKKSKLCFTTKMVFPKSLKFMNSGSEPNQKGEKGHYWGTPETNPGSLWAPALVQPQPGAAGAAPAAADRALRAVPKDPRSERPPAPHGALGMVPVEIWVLILLPFCLGIFLLLFFLGGELLLFLLVVSYFCLFVCCFFFWGGGVPVFVVILRDPKRNITILGRDPQQKDRLLVNDCLICVARLFGSWYPCWMVQRETTRKTEAILFLLGTKIYSLRAKFDLLTKVGFPTLVHVESRNQQDNL